MSRRFALVCAAAAIGLSALPAVANATASWQSGPLVESHDVNCITGDVEQEAGAFLSYYADPTNPPQVGQVYYVDLYMAGMGDPCAGGAYADVNLQMPSGTAPAVSAQYPVKCFFKAPSSSSFSSLPSQNCPQNLGVGPYGYSVDPTGINPPFWQVVQGDAIEIQVPVVSTQPLQGSPQLRGYIQLADGQTNPILQPVLSMIVNPAGAQNVSGGNGTGGSQIGIVYASPSITSNVQQINTSTTVGILGYVRNNSNPGHAVAQVAYADSAGDCTTPGTTVYTTNQAALQNPQTQISGSVTGLYADVAYCWRLVATVTSGPQTGTYYGNWEYFVTNGTYHSYSGEPAPANKPAAATGCSSSGSGCATAACTSAKCAVNLESASLAGEDLTVSLSGTGSGSVSDGKYIACPSNCSASYLKGATVTLTAAPASGSTFAGWNGGGCSGTGTCTVAMTTVQAVTATFTRPSTTTITTTTTTTTPPLVQSAGLVHGQSIRSVTDKGLKLQLNCGTSCHAIVRLLLPAATASKLHLKANAKNRKAKKQPVSIGSATINLGSAGAKTITVKLTGKAARALLRMKHLRLTVALLVTGAGGKSTSKSFSVNLRH